MSAHYDTSASDELRDRYRRSLEESVDGATDALDGPGQRNAYRMHVTLGEICSVLDNVDYTTDARSARALARIRARLDAYYSNREGLR